MANVLFTDDDRRFMARALKLAKRGQFSTQPNPRVGCVVVNGGKVVGEGFHEKAGQAHAEVNALAEAREHAQGATVYVSLEPCSHTGRTPPCTAQLIEAGVTRVIYATNDSNPQVGGNGALQLEAAGVEVQGGLMAAEARILNRGFFHRHELGRPFVTVKLATTLDGKIGLKSGQSKWITGEDARADVQRLRARSCAIVTGSGTVRADNPEMIVRDQSLITLGRQPQVVVLDTNLSLSSEYKIFSTAAKCSVVYVQENLNNARELAEQGVRLYQVAEQIGEQSIGNDRRVDLRETLRWLAAEQCNEILVEAGPELASAFIASDLWDEIIVYMAPKLIGSSGKEGFPLPPIHELADAKNLEFTDVRFVGSDLRIKLTASH